MSERITKPEATDNRTRSQKRAVIFMRTRSLPPAPALDQAQLEAQRRYCHQVAAKLSAEVIREFAAIGGATDAPTRRAVEELLETADEGIDYVIAGGLDRLARRSKELAQMVRRLSAAGAELVTTADAGGRFAEKVVLFCLVEADRERVTRS